eukprot:2733483-Prymnesium_polylepis.1
MDTALCSVLGVVTELTVRCRLATFWHAPRSRAGGVPGRCSPIRARLSELCPVGTARRSRCRLAWGSVPWRSSWRKTGRCFTV